MAKIIFVHGWGFGPSFWDGIREELADLPTDTVDLGFFGSGKTADGDIYVTHSMGFAWALKHVKPTAIVAINGFTKFCSGPDWPEGVPPRMLSRMIRQFARAPETVWCDFMKNSGMKDPEYPDNADDHSLLSGLKDLEAWDVRQAFSDFSGDKLIMASTQDRIVPEKLTSASFGDDVIWYKGGNHLLPLYEAQSICTHIRQFLDKLK